MQIVPISETGWRGPAKPAAYGVAVDWARQELVDGTYDRFVTVADDGSETIDKLFLPVVVYPLTTALKITVYQ